MAFGSAWRALPRRARAALFGCAVATGLVGLAEVAARGLELYEGIEFPFDEPGRKYATRRLPEFLHNAKSHVLNTDGFRDREFTREKPPGRLRVAVLGDSVTFGAAARPDEVWPAIAERELRAQGRDVEFYNFAIEGYDVEQCAATLRHRVWDFDPDLVVYGYFTNDHVPSRLIQVGPVYVFVDDELSAAEAVLPVGMAMPLLRASALFRQVQGTWIAHREGDRRIDNRLLHPWKIVEPDATPFLERHLDEMVADARAHDTPLVVYGIAPHVVASPNRQVCDRIRFPGFCEGQLRNLEKVRRMVELRGVPYLDSVPAWRATGRESFFPGNVPNDPLHPNAEGHAVLGRWFARHFQSLAPATIAGG